MFDGYVFPVSDDDTNTSILPVLRPGQIAFVAPKELGSIIVQDGIDGVGRGWQEKVRFEIGKTIDRRMPWCNVLVSVTKMPTGQFLATIVSIEGKDHLNIAYVLSSAGRKWLIP